ncbi:MAG: hypothetical protein QOF48_2626 [Verrucomicrobiota bacterium]|jgi:response regulator RpfG family c-di-GMP phosphodiesterase
MSKEKILFVDDDAPTLQYFRLALGGQFNITTAQQGAEGLDLIRAAGPFAVVISDLQMAEMNGVEFLQEVKIQSPETVRMILTGYAAAETAIQLVNEAGIFRFLTKPCPGSALTKAVHDALQQYRLVVAERDLFENTLAGVVRTLTEILSMVAPQVFDRAVALKKSAVTLASNLKMENIWELEIAAMLSHIGYVTIPRRIFTKRRAGIGLEAAEQDLINRVPEFGRNLLANIPRFEGVSDIVFYQNKNFDGSGFPPDNIAGHCIPFGARILKVVGDLGELLWEGIPAGKGFKILRSRQNIYDSSILDAAYACFGECAVLEGPNEAFSIPIKVDELQLGHRLISNIETLDGTLLLSAGSEVSEAKLEKIRNFEQLFAIKEPILVKNIKRA